MSFIASLPLPISTVVIELLVMTTKVFSQYSTWNTCPTSLVLFLFYYPLLHETLTWVCYKHLSLRGTPSMVFYDTYNLQNGRKPKHTAHGEL